MELISGYGETYDPFPALKRLKMGNESALNELWENLYHQGDVNSASYASVPSLVNLGQLSLVGAIEVARLNGSPEIPDQLAQPYFQALQQALKVNPNSEEQFQGYYIIHAAVNGQTRLATALNLLSVEEVLAEYA